MSDTPRTDALRAKHSDGIGNSFYGEMMQLSRDIERELAEARQDVERAERELAEMWQDVERLTLLESMCSESFSSGCWYIAEELRGETLRAAIDAARRKP